MSVSDAEKAFYESVLDDPEAGWSLQDLRYAYFLAALDGSLPGGGGGGGGDVSSVNGKTGAVVLDAGDVGAVAASLLETIPVYVQFDGTNWPAHDENPDRVRVFLSQAYEDAPAPTYRNVLDSWLAYHPALVP